MSNETIWWSVITDHKIDLLFKVNFVVGIFLLQIQSKGCGALRSVIESGIGTLYVGLSDIYFIYQFLLAVLVLQEAAVSATVLPKTANWT